MQIMLRHNRELIIVEHDGNVFAQVHGYANGLVKVLREKACGIAKVIQETDFTVRIVYNDGVSHRLQLEGGKIKIEEFT